VRRAAVRRPVVRRAADLRLAVFRVDGLRRRDCPLSDMAIAIACLRLFTFRPEPLFNEPVLCSCITLWTLRFCAAVAMGAPPFLSITKR
jgi:hypothetical protein